MLLPKSVTIIFDMSAPYSSFELVTCDFRGSLYGCSCECELLFFFHSTFESHHLTIEIPDQKSKNLAYPAMNGRKINVKRQDF